MEFLTLLWLGKPLWMWLAFMGIVALLLTLDLGVLHRKQREIGVRESLIVSAGYIGLALAFGAWVWWYLGETAGVQYLTGFAIEKSLAIDNVFVIAMIFGYFAVPRLHQHRVLFWGIIGVVVLRAIMIGVGAAMVERFGWLLWVFAAFLIVTGIKMWRMADTPYDVAGSPLLKWVRSRFRVTETLQGERFWVMQADPATGKPVRYMTPLFLALIMVEFVDVVFAVDSVPAIFAITTDPVHRLHLEHLRNPGPSRPLFRTGGNDRSLPLSEIRPRSAAGLHRRQDPGRRRVGHRQGAPSAVARHHPVDLGRGRRLVAVEDAETRASVSPNCLGRRRLEP
jgi:tellurite resistance protein TerC